MKEEKKSGIFVITGPESCGKSTLAVELASHYKGKYVAEYARIYVEQLQRSYEYKDIENIALYQFNEFKKHVSEQKGMLFFDTYLIITKVWFEHVYQRYPAWLDDAIRACSVDLYLLCYPDLPWIDDPVRENGHIREWLFEKYREELEQYGLDYVVVSGSGDKRVKQAINSINQKVKI